MIVGIPTVDRVAFDIEAMRRKEITVVNVRRQNGCVAPALDLVRRERDDVMSLVTHRFALEESATAFDLVGSYSDGVIKAMINLD